MVLLLLCSPVSLQEPKTQSTEGQRAEQTVGFLPTDWGVSKSQAAIITLTSSISAENVGSYQLALNNTGDIGKIEPHVTNESRFVRWADPKEKAASTFIPEGWSADLQIIRPYKSMSGFVFFARGDENTLVYVFQPFMPLYIPPSTSLCETASICFSSIISADKVREMSLGNAPIVVSNFKTPGAVFHK